ncbi:hypothetical protein IMG5_135110 [Ichthyophthirius multifiliis]|uniref:Dolichyl-diphosphooligosaccharide--protein glycosyltransferase 48 kDa subunit n=1 Tax=Ichthyophthirius multifiliis TaxID=5932 RepID=G0QWT9_ICHMU|nr:hypothetical protein IMG5_135110 [Ichthyophthirius multifiliis]EGR30314.1 hypothetical protein IMG5_135110 [Ichthyophthirius multifiliis]|eukprot:XP_004031901.1 hypothetical protein IMG5_135110 [Ichthyophthirius multifiliis]
MIIIATQPMDGKGLTKNKIIDFFDSGRNVFIASDIDASKTIRQIFNEFGVDLDSIGSSVLDHFNYADQIDNNQIFSNNIINQPVICPQLKYPILYKGSGISMAPYEMNQVYGILRAEDTTYSYNYEKSETENTGNHIILVAGVQGRNNARAILTGSIELFSNEFYKQEKFSNREFMQNIMLWNFGETGILKVGKINNTLDGQSQKVTEYRVGDKCEYSIEIFMWNRLTNTWNPYVTDDLTVEFIMLDPYVRMPLKNVQNTALYKAKFQVPEKHGVFKFNIKYEKPGFNFIYEATKVTVRPFKHNEYPRYLEQAYPYYISTWATIIGFCVLVFYFLFHKD